MDTKNIIHFPVQIDTVCFNQKPKHQDICSLKPRLAAQNITQCTPEQFAEAILQGRTYNPGILQGGAKAENWIEQQLFCVDVDNNSDSSYLTVEDALKRCDEWELMPFLIYATFSHTEEKPKFRVCFLCNTLITDGEERDRVQKGLQAIFPECDGACYNRDRLFYAGKEILYSNFSEVFKPVDAEFIGEAVALENELAKKPVKLHYSEDINAKAKAYDLLSYIQQDTGQTGRRAGRLAAFDPCPICGHKGDFFVYPNTNTFVCFGANGIINGKRAGGTIIDYIIYTQNVDTKEAVKRFKFDVLKLDPQQEKQTFIENKMIEQHNNHTSEKADKLPAFIIPKYDKNGNFLYFTVSCPELAEYFRQRNTYFWLSSKGGDKPMRYLYKKGVYVIVSDSEIKSILRDYIAMYNTELVKTKTIDEAAKLIFMDNVIVKPEEVNCCENIVNFKNGLLNLETMQLLPHSNIFYSTVQLPLDWNPEAYQQKGAPVFENYLNTLTSGDESRKRFLLQWMGCILSNIRGDKVKKSVFMYGKGDTGKSQILRLCTQLLGDENVCSTSLQTLEKDIHSTYALYGKRLCIDPDMNFTKIAGLSVYKKISGGDPMDFNPKFKNAFTDTYKGFCWFAMNELPKFGGDHGDHVYNRMVLIPCNNVIPADKRDPLLLSKMYAEREAILCLCMDAAQTFMKNNQKFQLPNDTAKELEAYKQENSPVRQFFVECCEFRTNCRDGITTSTLLRIFNVWTDEHGDGYHFKPTTFLKELELYTGLKKKDLKRKYNGNYYYPLTLTQEIKNQYSGMIHQSVYAT